VDPAARERLRAAVARVDEVPGPKAQPGWRIALPELRFSPLATLMLVLAAGFVGLLSGRWTAPSTEAVTATAAGGTPPLVSFVFISTEARSVAVVGDFNDWILTATPLAPTAEAGVWSVALRLPPGRYTYSFIVDGKEWYPDPVAPPAPGEEFDRPSSVMLVEASL
jgi:hypothetical protein